MIPRLAILFLVLLILGPRFELKAQSRAGVLYNVANGTIAAPLGFFFTNVYAGTNIIVYTNGDGTITVAGDLIGVTNFLKDYVLELEGLATNLTVHSLVGSTNLAFSIRMDGTNIVGVETNGQILGVSGSASKPTYSFFGHPTTGYYTHPTFGGLYFTTAGTLRFAVDSSGLSISDTLRFGSVPSAPQAWIRLITTALLGTTNFNVFEILNGRNINATNALTVQAATASRIALFNSSKQVTNASVNLDVTSPNISQVLGFHNSTTVTNVDRDFLNDVVLWDDFLGGGASAGIYGREGWSGSASGTATLLQSPVWWLGRPGVIGLNSGSAAGDRVSLTALLNSTWFSNGPVFFETSVYVSVLPTTGADYQGRYGLQDSSTTPSTDGAYFEVTNTTVFPQWKCVTANVANRTSTAAISNVVVGWNYLRLEGNTNGNEVIFYVGTCRTNAYPVATNTSNIPIDYANGRVGNLLISIMTSNAVAFTNYVDYVGYRHQLNFPR